jgi:hypothetical protein
MLRCSFAPDLSTDKAGKCPEAAANLASGAVRRKRQTGDQQISQILQTRLNHQDTKQNPNNSCSYLAAIATMNAEHHPYARFILLANRLVHIH